MADLSVRSAAALSGCGKYRWCLTRHWDDDLPTCAWVMLNPSTATADEDDPTVRRCVGFSRRWGHGGIAVVNLFALRAADPKKLLAAEDPVGPLCDETIRVYCRRRFTVAAWGALAPPRRAAEVLAILRAEAAEVVCLGLTRGGQPRHPLYLAADTEPMLYGGRP